MKRTRRAASHVKSARPLPRRHPRPLPKRRLFCFRRLNWISSHKIRGKYRGLDRRASPEMVRFHTGIQQPLQFVAGDIKTKIVAILIGQFRGGRFKGQNRVAPKFLCDRIGNSPSYRGFLKTICQRPVLLTFADRPTAKCRPSSAPSKKPALPDRRRWEAAQSSNSGFLCSSHESGGAIPFPFHSSSTS